MVEFGSVQKRISLSIELQKNLDKLAEYISQQSDRSLQMMMTDGILKSNISVGSLISFAINFTTEMLVYDSEQDYAKRMMALRNGTTAPVTGTELKLPGTILERKDLKPLLRNNELQTYLLLALYQMIMDPKWVIADLTSYQGQQFDNLQSELLTKINSLIQSDTARGQTIKSSNAKKTKYKDKGQNTGQ